MQDVKLLPDEQEHPPELEDKQLAESSSDTKEITSETNVILCRCPSPNIDAMLAETTRGHLRHIGWLLEEVVRGSQEKVGLAQAAYDSVRAHVNALLERRAELDGIRRSTDIYDYLTSRSANRRCPSPSDFGKAHTPHFFQISPLLRAGLVLRELRTAQFQVSAMTRTSLHRISAPVASCSQSGWLQEAMFEGPPRKKAKRGRRKGQKRQCRNLK
jgi:hypothetical protein